MTLTDYDPNQPSKDKAMSICDYPDCVVEAVVPLTEADGCIIAAVCADHSRAISAEFQVMLWFRHGDPVPARDDISWSQALLRYMDPTAGWPTVETPMLEWLDTRIPAQVVEGSPNGC